MAPLIDVPDAIYPSVLRLVLTHLDRSDPNPVDASPASLQEDEDERLRGWETGDATTFRPWSQQELTEVFGQARNKTLRLYMQLMDTLSAHPGKQGALSRPKMSELLGEPASTTDAVFREVSKMAKQIGRTDPPVRWTYGDTIDPALPRLSYRYMQEDDAAAWRQARQLPPLQ